MSKKFKYSNIDDRTIQEISELLGRGAVGIYPTDTVYGIGALAGDNNQANVQRIFEYKHRELTQTLPLLISSYKELERYAQDISNSCKTLVQAYWPGALTVVVKASKEVPEYLKKSDGSIALRVPDEKLIIKLIELLGYPLATTSANIHGEPSSYNFLELNEKLREEVDFVIDGGVCKKEDASTIVSFMSKTPVILRQGSLARRQIEDLIGECRDRA